MVMIQAVLSVCSLPDNRLVSGSNDNTVRVWDLSTGECVRVLEGHSGVRAWCSVMIRIHTRVSHYAVFPLSYMCDMSMRVLCVGLCVLRDPSHAHPVSVPLSSC